MVPRSSSVLGDRPASAGRFNHEGQFRFIKELHRSRGGSVHLVRIKDSCQFKGVPEHVVLKRRQDPELGCSKDILREYEVLKGLDHPNIIKCYGYFLEQRSEVLCLVLEYANRGDLQTDVQARAGLEQPFSNDEVWNILGQLLRGLVHVHAKGIVHRDIKSLNVLLTDVDLVKLGDFGVSRVISEATLALNSFYGTPLYLSPEIMEGKPYTQATDVWSLGVVLYELLTLQRPFAGKCLQEIVAAVLSGRRRPIPENRPAEFKLLVSQMLQQEQGFRPQTHELLDTLRRLGCGKLRHGSRAATAIPTASHSEPRRAAGASAVRARAIREEQQLQQQNQKQQLRPQQEQISCHSNDSARLGPSVAARASLGESAEGIASEQLPQEVTVIRVHRRASTGDERVPASRGTNAVDEQGRLDASSRHQQPMVASGQVVSKRDARWEERQQLHVQRAAGHNEASRTDELQQLQDAASHHKPSNANRAAGAGRAASCSSHIHHGSPVGSQQVLRVRSRAASRPPAPAVSGQTAAERCRKNVSQNNGQDGMHGGYPRPLGRDAGAGAEAQAFAYRPHPRQGRGEEDKRNFQGHPIPAEACGGRVASKPPGSGRRYDLIAHRWIDA